MNINCGRTMHITNPIHWTCVRLEKLHDYNLYCFLSKIKHERRSLMNYAVNFCRSYSERNFIGELGFLLLKFSLLYLECLTYHPVKNVLFKCALGIAVKFDLLFSEAPFEFVFCNTRAKQTN